MPTRLYGAQQVEITNFRGVCFDASPTELDPSLAADSADVVFDGDYLKPRGGRVRYNSSAPASAKVRAIGMHQPASGTRSILVCADTGWYANVDNDVDNSFEQTISTIGASDVLDLFQWRTNHYLGTSTSGLIKWTGSGGGSSVSMLSAPTVAPVLQVDQTVIEDFEVHTDWTVSGTITKANEGTRKIQSSNSLKLTAASSASEGAYLVKPWKSGGATTTLDLSTASELWLWVQGSHNNIQFRVAILENGYTSGAPNWAVFPPQIIKNKGKWELVRVPLGGIPPESRNFSYGMAIEWLDATSYAPNRILYFDRAMLHGPLSSGSYKYFCTYADLDSSGNVVNESNPSTLINSASTPSCIIQGPGGDVGAEDEILPARGIRVIVPTTTTGTIDSIRVYRYLTSGNFRYPRLVKSLLKAGQSTTTTEAVSAGETEIDLTSATGFAVGDYAVLNGIETVKITGISSNTVTVLRGLFSTGDQAHSSGVTFIETDWTGASTTTAEAVDATETDIDLTAAASFAVNDYAIMGGVEVVKITAIVSNTVTVTRGQYGTVGQVHNNGASFIKAAVFVDTKDDGSIAVENTDQLESDSRISPPSASAWGVVNNRVLAGNVTISGTTYPQRVYISEFEYPERFANYQNPDFPTSAGWFELSGGETVRRIIEHDGMAVVFTDRAVWSIDGSGWDDFTLRKRLDVGLDARNAVVSVNRIVYFLAQDGVRLLAPNHTNDGVWESWVISEPVQSKLRAIPYAYRSTCAMGVDEQDRVVLSIIRSGQTLPDRELVFDPQAPGALARGTERQRPGWSFNTRGHNFYYRLPRSNPDAGQLLAGDTATGIVYYLNRSSTDTALTTDEDSSGTVSSISWNWTSSAKDAGPGGKNEFVFCDVIADASVGTATTAAEAIDASETTIDVTLATVFFAGGYVQVDDELMAISATDTAPNPDTITVTRGVGGTEAATHSNGATMTPVSVFTAAGVLDGVASSNTQLVSLTDTATGLIEAHKRFGAAERARYLQLKISGVHRTAQIIRAIRIGVLDR